MFRIVISTALLLLATQAANAADLHVKVEGITQPKGMLSALLVNSKEAWDGKSAPVGMRRVEITATGFIELTFDGLAPGNYAIRLMHDENGNGKLDRNQMGMPIEGYGYSNNPRVMRAATFEEARFSVPAAGKSIQIVSIL